MSKSLNARCIRRWTVEFINCPECFGDDDCETCDGSGRIEITVPVTWTTIKAIWAKGVEHFEAAPQQENV